MWDGRLQGIEAVIQRQQRVPAERHDDCLVRGRESLLTSALLTQTAR